MFIVSPLASWMRNDIVFIYTPVLVCKFPQHTGTFTLTLKIVESSQYIILPFITVGVDDAISSTALLYSQFFKLEKKVW